jgi:hypothetical protein
MGAERSWYHAHGGLFVARGDGGTVLLEVREGASRDALLVARLELTAGEWASIVAHASAAGETGTSFMAATRLHETGAL